MIAGRLLRLLPITALLPSVLTTCVYADTSLSDTGTAYAEGFASALIESHLHWLDDTYRLTDKGGTLYVSPPSSWKGDASTVERLLADVPGVHSVSVTAVPAALPSNTVATTANWPILAGTPFPRGRLFAPLIADSKQPSFFASYRLYNMPWGNYHVGAVGYGGTLGLYRWHQRLWGGQVQLDFSAGVFSQFDLDVPAPELINTDYTVGLPLTWRRGSDSARLNLYHQSSHLGPLYFSQFHPQNYALSFEAVTFFGRTGGLTGAGMGVAATCSAQPQQH
ncbi:DUF1207 domain-containing protein [Acidihalobacter aeolianus]|uniref:DUF1207 domain-containing protein n=1 Tax=Acidihalobacter aeolianus TaxID=2792603 RepID=UPI0009F45C9D|nr:DUF1207 domain-containing protein [Acidihalobacter aeolianus]